LARSHYYELDERTPIIRGLPVNEAFDHPPVNQPGPQHSFEPSAPSLSEQAHVSVLNENQPSMIATIRTRFRSLTFRSRRGENSNENSNEQETAF